MNLPTQLMGQMMDDLVELLQGDFYHWVDLWNHFELFFETYVKPRKDLQPEGNFAESNDPFPKDAVLQILRVTQIILENCPNKYLNNSNDVIFLQPNPPHLLLHCLPFVFLCVGVTCVCSS
jgi:hypothetical protein